MASRVFLCSKPIVNVLLVTQQFLSSLLISLQTLKMPLGLKYACPSESTWKLAVSSLLKVLSIGLPVARQHAASGKFDTMWPELANAFEDFLFTKRYKRVLNVLWLKMENLSSLFDDRCFTARPQIISPFKNFRRMKPLMLR